MSTIIDRRLNTGAKNLGNRQRFIRRARDQIQKSIRDNLGNRPISDTTNGEKIRIPIDTIREPNFGHDWNTGESRRVLPGNQDFVPNDTIKRPVGGQGKGRGNQASDSDETGEDEFAFELTRDEFYDLFFEDLELPDMIRRQLKTTKSWEIKREGISTAGNPSNLNVIRTMKSSLGRRIILRKPNEKEIRALEEELTQTDPNSDRYQEILSLIESLTRKVRAVTYVDPIDLRYNVFSKKPTPSNSAVMFCVMDVSASMDEHKKDIAKRFFMLLYLFLQKKYDTVRIEFIRHHTEASRVDEQTFFYDRQSGGTKVSPALEMVRDIIKAEYNPDLYNIYVCQASDGDNWDADNQTCRQILEQEILPIVQYMAYVEIKDAHENEAYPMLSFTYSNGLMSTYQAISKAFEKLQITRAYNAADIYSVFRKLFEKK